MQPALAREFVRLIGRELSNQEAFDEERSCGSLHAVAFSNVFSVRREADIACRRTD
jgi:hypothetical protein